MQGADDYCDPTIEQCTKTEELSEFEDFEEYNRFLGQMSALLAFAPLAVFVYPTWLSRTDDEKEKTIENHTPYLAVWAYFVGSHFLVYAPLLFLWISLQNEPEPHAYWYAYWL